MFSPTMFIPFLAIGVILIAASLLMRKKSESSRGEASDETITVAVNQQIEKSIADADNAMEQLNRMSSMILDELENKYKELLFLYQLIDDKKIEVESLANETLHLSETVRNSLLEQSMYLPTTGKADGGAYNGVYFESRPIYPAEPANMRVGAYSNTNYNKAGMTGSNNRDKGTGGNLFDSDASAHADSVKPMDLQYSGDRLPPQYAEKYKDIIQLTSDGKTPSEIAQSLNIGQGEVKLILTLARVRQD